MAGSESTDSEEWRAIPGYDGYEISSRGRARSLDRMIPLPTRWGTTVDRVHKGRPLRLRPKPNGFGHVYASIAISKTRYIQINRAVCLAFHGPAPSPEHQAAHLDGNTRNNAVANLVWATPLENAAHKIWHGTSAVGSRNGAAKITEADVRDIFLAYAEGESAGRLAARMGVSSGLITMVIRREIWFHVAVDRALVAQAQRMTATNIREARARTNAERRRKAEA